MSTEMTFLLVFTVIVIVAGIYGFATDNPILASPMVLLPISIMLILQTTYTSESLDEDIVIMDTDKENTYFKETTTGGIFKERTLEFYIDKRGTVESKVLELSSDCKIKKHYSLDEGEQAFIEYTVAKSFSDEIVTDVTLYLPKN